MGHKKRKDNRSRKKKKLINKRKGENLKFKKHIPYDKGIKKRGSRK